MRRIELGRARRRCRAIGVCWLLAALLGCGRTDLSARLADAEIVGVGRDGVRAQTLVVDGDERPALLTRADVEVRFRGVEVRRGAVLTFGIAVDPDGWKEARDGILFRVYWKSGVHRRLVYSRYLDPVRRAADRRWVDATVPLTPFMSGIDEEAMTATITLATTSGPRGDSGRGGAGWGRPQIVYPRRQPAAAADDRPNVVLISLDTLRADRLGIYGYHRPTSPHIDAWAKRAATFTQVQSPANATLDSHMSVLTGLHPDVHGVRALRNPPGQRRRLDTLDRRRITLAEALRAAGYTTAAFVHASVWMNPEFGFEQGFDTYRVVNHDAALMNGSDVFPWLDQHRRERFFLFVHYFDIHSDWNRLPYDSPAPFDRQFLPDYSGAFTGCDEGVCVSRYLLQLNRGGGSLPPDDLAYVSALYDGGIAYTDTQIGRLLKRLRDLDLYDDTMVVLFADHGEELDEHGSFLHEQLYQEVVGVPLIIGHPTLIPEGRRIDTPVQTLDIMPTVLEAVGVPAEDGVQGRSLLPLLRGDEVDRVPLFSSNGNGKSYAVRDGAWKLIVERTTGTERLYDLRNDPEEQHDLSKRHPERTGHLRAALDACVAENDVARATFDAARAGDAPKHLVPSEADIERLRNLGYVE
jgi:arylsulfatase A-like enzyme